MPGWVGGYSGAFETSRDVEARKKAQAELDRELAREAQLEQERQAKEVRDAKIKQLTSAADPSLHAAKLNLTNVKESEMQALLATALSDFSELCALRGQELSDEDQLTLAAFMRTNEMDVFDSWAYQQAYDHLVAAGIFKQKELPQPVVKFEPKQKTAEELAAERLQEIANAVDFLPTHTRTSDIIDPERRQVVSEFLVETFGTIGKRFFAEAADKRNFFPTQAQFSRLTTFMRERNMSFASPVSLHRACTALFPEQYMSDKERKNRQLDEELERLDLRDPEYRQKFKQIKRQYAELEAEGR